MTEKHFDRDDDYWLKKLGADAFQVCRRKGTERPFTGALLDEKREGLFLCACCQQPLFASASKYDSGSGWPSFFKPCSEDAILEHPDRSHGMSRTEITCSRCGCHLGHVFEDGPRPTGLRYCVNSLSLGFEPG